MGPPPHGAHRTAAARAALQWPPHGLVALPHDRLALPHGRLLALPHGRNNAQQPQPSSNGSPPQEPSEPPKRVPLTARERLRAARVLGKYAEPGGGPPPSKASPKKPEFGSRVLDALRETDSGKRADRKRSGLPEAPSNMFDDSKRGLPKEGWTFEALPFGTDVLVIVVSFALITTLMFGTTYLVWKLGAIHFNEY